MKNIIKLNSLGELLNTENLPCPCVGVYKDGEDEYVLYRDLNGNDEVAKNGEVFDKIRLLENMPLCIVSLEDDNIITLECTGYLSYRRYSYDCKEWQNFNSEVLLNKGDRIYVEGDTSWHGYGFFKFHTTKKFNVMGNAKSMQEGAGGSFNFLFAETKVMDASNLLVYQTAKSMFAGSTIEKGPILASQTADMEGYSHIFENCVHLKSVTCLLSRIYYGVINDWMLNVPAGGVLTKVKGVEYPSGASGIPEGWDVVEI